MKKAIIGIAMLVLALGSALVSTPAADASTTYTQKHPGAWQIWSRSRCEQGKQLFWVRLHDDRGNAQGRLYAYHTEGKACVFAVDHMPGSHKIRIQAVLSSSPDQRAAEDYGNYSEYAGALAGPYNHCIEAYASLVANGGDHYDRPNTFVCW
jgi:hypothetical protein